MEDSAKVILLASCSALMRWKPACFFGAGRALGMTPAVGDLSERGGCARSAIALAGAELITPPTGKGPVTPRFGAVGGPALVAGTVRRCAMSRRPPSHP